MRRPVSTLSAVIISRALAAAFLVCALASPAGVARAQYMYLDSNGDGLRSSADMLNPTGVPTTVDVWL